MRWSRLVAPERQTRIFLSGPYLIVKDEPSSDNTQVLGRKTSESSSWRATCNLSSLVPWLTTANIPYSIPHMLSSFEPGSGLRRK